MILFSRGRQAPWGSSGRREGRVHPATSFFFLGNKKTLGVLGSVSFFDSIFLPAHTAVARDLIHPLASSHVSVDTYPYPWMMHTSDSHREVADTAAAVIPHHNQGKSAENRKQQPTIPSTVGRLLKRLLVCQRYIYSPPRGRSTRLKTVQECAAPCLLSRS